ncbi:hypothetical protein GmHk_03G006695 [Glycine max]|nr:hypothetical protein GmHk_03G006695 [Glycine max]
MDMSQRSQISSPIEPNIHVLGARVNTKGSNAEVVVNPSGEDHVAHVISTMGLYVHRQDSTELSPTIHNMAYANDVVRVSVDKVINDDVEVLLPTLEIKYVRQTLGIFIARPTPLVKLVLDEVSAISPNKVIKVFQPVNDVAVDDPLRELIKSLVDIYEKPIQLVWDVSKFGIPDVDASLFLTCANVNEIILGVQCLNIASLQLWTILGHGSMYGFLEPQSILNAKDRRGQCQEYIEKWLKESHRKVYLGAYLNQAHWQLLVLCPTNNVVVWFCSLQKMPDVHIKAAINNAFKTLNTTSDGKIHQSTPQWIEVKSHVQSGGYEYSYYVMHWIWNIIGGKLKTDWTMWFGDGTPLVIDTIITLWKKWAAYFLRLRSIQLERFR